MVLKNKVAIVTGSSRGVGASIAKVFAREGAVVCVNYFQSQAKAEQVVDFIKKNGGDAFTQYADVTNASDVDKLVMEVFERNGRVDIVVNNALPKYRFDPSANYTSIESINWDNFTEQFDGAVKATYNLIRSVLPHMKERKFSKIIPINRLNARIVC